MYTFISQQPKNPFYYGAVDQTTPKSDTIAPADTPSLALRKKLAPIVTYGIFIGTAGLILYSVYNTYAKAALKPGKAHKKEALKKFWDSVQGGIVGSAAFAVFVAGVVGFELWMQGLTLKDTADYFKKNVKESSGVYALVPNGGITNGG